jgi:hypothetical protein
MASMDISGIPPAVGRTKIPKPVKVIYIAGWARSSSTLLDVLLGGIDGFFSTGELRHLWQWGLGEGRLCGCGTPVPECHVWASIVEALYGDADGPLLRPPEEIHQLQRRSLRLRHLPRILLQRRGRPIRWSDLRSYAAILDRLYTAIAQVTGAQVIVESSKQPQDAAVLPLLERIEPFVVHLVRDPRGVAKSMQRKVLMQESTDDPVGMPTSGPASSTLGWMRANLATEAVRLRYGPASSLLVRYEDLVADPSATLERVADMVGLPFAGLRFVDFRTVELAENHTVWGNPSRFRTGRTIIRHDADWVDALGTRARQLTTALSLPLLPRYRYPLKTSARSSKESERR